MIRLSCLCGQIRLEMQVRPAFVHECNCTLCRKTGARRAYPDPATVRVEGETRGYSRRDKGEPFADVRFCGTCGATTHFVLTEQVVARLGNTMMGVNTALAEECDPAGVELRHPDGQAWAGEGEFAYVRAPRMLG